MHGSHRLLPEESNVARLDFRETLVVSAYNAHLKSTWSILIPVKAWMCCGSHTQRCITSCSSSCMPEATMWGMRSLPYELDITCWHNSSCFRGSHFHLQGRISKSVAQTTMLWEAPTVHLPIICKKKTSQKFSHYRLYPSALANMHGILLCFPSYFYFLTPRDMVHG